MGPAYSLRQDRLERVWTEMAAMGLDQMVVTSPTSIDYLTGCAIKPFEQLYVLYLRRGEMPALYYSAVNGVRTISGTEDRMYGPQDSPLKELAQSLFSGRLGVDKDWSARFLLPLMEARPDITPVLASAALDRVRMIKDRREQEKMRRASRMDDGVFEKGFRMLTGSLSELQMSNQMGRLFEEAIGRHMGVSMVSYGANAANPHHSPTEKYLAPGECVLIDSGKALNKYMSDMTRTAFFQTVSQEDRELYQIVLEANLAGIQAARAGDPVRSVDRAAREVIEKAGYGPFFIHRTGHGIGMEGHEYPSIDQDCDLILQPGMCFSVEPGIYLPGRVGIRIEDVVMITEEGTEVLNRYTKELQILG